MKKTLSFCVFVLLLSCASLFLKDLPYEPNGKYHTLVVGQLVFHSLEVQAIRNHPWTDSVEVNVGLFAKDGVSDESKRLWTSSGSLFFFYNPEYTEYELEKIEVRITAKSTTPVGENTDTSTHIIDYAGNIEIQKGKVNNLGKIFVNYNA